MHEGRQLSVIELHKGEARGGASRTSTSKRMKKEGPVGKATKWAWVVEGQLLSDEEGEMNKLIHTVLLGRAPPTRRRRSAKGDAEGLTMRSDNKQMTRGCGHARRHRN